jgi:hypothetical protein
MNVIDLDGDRRIGLSRNKKNGGLQASFEKSGISVDGRAQIIHKPCKCGKGRTRIIIGMSDEAIQALFVLYKELYEKEQSE